MALHVEFLFWIAIPVLFIFLVNNSFLSFPGFSLDFNDSFYGIFLVIIGFVVNKVLFGFLKINKFVQSIVLFFIGLSAGLLGISVSGGLITGLFIGAYFGVLNLILG